VFFPVEDKVGIPRSGRDEIKNKAPCGFIAGGFIAALDVSDFIISAYQI
jgi:hypothetical protein